MSRRLPLKPRYYAPEPANANALYYAPATAIVDAVLCHLGSFHSFFVILCACEYIV